MNILFVGHGSKNNRGCEAIVRASASILKEQFDDVHIVLASYDWETDSKHEFGFPIKVIRHHDFSCYRKWSKDWFFLKAARLVNIDLRDKLIFAPLAPAVDNADLVLSIGGDNYTEDYGLGALRSFLDLNSFIKDKGKKLVIWGASLGPFSQEGLELGVLENLKHVDLITVREERSYEYLKGLGLTNLVKVADPAFLLGVEKVALPFPEGSTVVGFNVSPLLKSYFPDMGEDRFLIESKKFLDELISSDGSIRLILLPHVTSSKPGEADDYTYLNKLYDALSFKDKVTLIPPTYNASQLKYIISRCNFYFGARTHSTIAALSSGVPTISIGYSAKAIGINADLFGHQEYVLDMKVYSSFELMKKYHLIKRNSGEIKQKLSEIMPEIKKMSAQNGIALKVLFEA